MAEEKSKPSYYAILPAKVRYDTELRPNAKLLYAEITALANSKGYCWMENSEFAANFGLDKKSVSRLISQLADKGYISVDIIRDPVTKKVTQRRIWVDTPPHRQKEDTPSPQKSGAPVDQKAETPHHQKAEENNTSSLSNIPPISPKGEEGKKELSLSKEVRAMLNEYIGKDMELAEEMVAFMEVRSSLKAVNSPKAIKALLKELDRLSDGKRSLKIELVRQSVTNSWKSVFPIRGVRVPMPAKEVTRNVV